ILRWQCDIVRCRWARLSRRGRSGRPATHRKVRSVVLRLARENESWGYRRIHGELAGLGIMVAPSTGWQMPKNAGINRAPGRHGPDAGSTAPFDSVLQAAGIRVIRSAVRAPRMNSVMERWIASCRRELLDRTRVWNLRHLMIVLREYEDFYNRHRPHRTLNQ